MEGKYVFISYKVEDSDDAVWVKETLESNGIQCWMAPDSIPGGSSYASEIENSIKDCSAFVLVLSEKAQGSKWVSKEVDRAINYGKRVMPFTLDNSPLTGDFAFYLSNVQRYDATIDKLEAMRTLHADIIKEFNSPKTATVFKKKPPKSKNNGEKAKMKLWKKILIGFILIPVIIAVAEFLITFVFSPSEPENNSSTESSSESTENNYVGIFDSDNEYETEATTSTASILDNLTFELDGVTYSLPCNVSELYENGWYCETREPDEVQINFYVEMKKGSSSIWIKTYSPFEYENAKFIDQKVGTVEYTPDCNVPFSVNGTIRPGSLYNDVIAEFGEPESNGSWMDNTEYCYFIDDNNYGTEASFVFYTDTSRCHSITLKNEVYSKKY